MLSDSSGASLFPSALFECHYPEGFVVRVYVPKPYLDGLRSPHARLPEEVDYEVGLFVVRYGFQDSMDLLGVEVFGQGARNSPD